MVYKCTTKAFCLVIGQYNPILRKVISLRPGSRPTQRSLRLHGVGTKYLFLLTLPFGRICALSITIMSSPSLYALESVWVDTRQRLSLLLLPVRLLQGKNFQSSRKEAKSVAHRIRSKPARDGGHSSFNKPTPQSLSTTFSAQSSKSITTGTPSARKRQQHLNVEFAASSTETEKKKTTEMVAEDIELWKKKFAAQADEGASAMEEIIGEISKRMIETYVAAMGKSLVDDFEKTVKSEIDSLKLKTLSFVDDSERPISDVEAVVLEDIRSAGIRIRDKAQRIRAWRAEYDKELQNSVFGAADTHLKILDEARSLALQHIGMKWAWTEGITHKDWVKYHELKDTFAECTENLKEIIASYPALLEAQDASARVEDEAMELASAAAKELTRLKEVAQYKILARDTSDNFETEAMRVAAQVAQEAKEDEKLLAEKIETFKDAISEDLSENSEAVIEAHGNGEASVNDFTVSVESGLESAATVAADNTSGQSSVPSQNPSHILHVHIQGEFALNSLRDDSLGATEMDGVPRSASEAERTGGLAVSDGFNSAQRDLSASCETGDSMESSSTPVAYDNRSDTGPSLAYEASETILGATQTMVGNLTDMTPVSVQGNEIDVDDYFQDEESSDESPAAETTATKPALFGAAAEFVPDRQPILEDYVDTDRICEAASMTYSSAVALAAEQYSSAASVVSAQVSGTPGPVHAKLFSSISNAYGDAVAKASDNFRDAVDAASRGMFGTPTETARTSLVDWAKVESIAAQRLNEGRLWAEVQYESAMVAMGMATPTPTSHADRMYQQAKHNYYAGLGMAQDHYSSFIAAASSAMHSMTATPTPTDFAGTASSMTSAAQISAASVVGAAREAASSAYSAAGAAVEQAGEAIDDYIASASLAVADSMQLAGGALAESWNNVVASLSSEVYGQPTPIAWHDQVADVDVEAATFSAAQKYEAVKMLVSELISGKEPTFTESVLSRLGAVYSTATASGASVLSEVSAAASSFGDKVGSAASQATDAAKDSVRQAKDEL